MARLRVLVAEDHSAMRNCIVNILSTDFEVIEAVSNGEDLIASAIARKPDVIVSDICMPRLGGVKASLRLRAAGILIPFVLVTALRKCRFPKQPTHKCSLTARDLRDL